MGGPLGIPVLPPPNRSAAMGWNEDRTEMARYIAELKQLLTGTALSPDARARALAALIEADAMTQAADQVHTAAELTRDDTVPLMLATARSFGEKAESLAWALRRFDESASRLSSSLDSWPER
jgi:hypothetical protein